MIEQDGFLSPDMVQVRHGNRTNHAATFKMVTEINRAVQSAMPTIGTLPRKASNLLASGYYIRGVQSLQGAVLVAELGMMSEGYTLLRSGLETLFHLGATIRSDSFGQQMARDHVKRMRTTIGYQRDAIRFDPEIEAELPQLQAALASMLPDGVDPAKMSLETVARLAELSAVYDGLYRSLSFAHAHPSLLSLNSIWDGDEQHEPRGVLWGPERNDRDEMGTILTLVCAAMFAFADQWCRLLVSVHAQEGEFHKRIKELGTKYVDVFSYSSSRAHS